MVTVIICFMYLITGINYHPCCLVQSTNKTGENIDFQVPVSNYGHKVFRTVKVRLLNACYLNYTWMSLMICFVHTYIWKLWPSTSCRKFILRRYLGNGSNITMYVLYLEKVLPLVLPMYICLCLMQMSEWRMS